MANVVKYSAYASFHCVTGGYFLATEKMATMGMQLHTLMQQDFSSMSLEQRAEYIAEQTAEIVKAVFADKVGKRILPKVKLPELPQAKPAEVPVVEVVTSTGEVVEVPVQPEVEPALRREVDNTKGQPNSTAKTTRTEIFENNEKHIFRDAPGHIPDTPENRKLLIDVASDPSNLLCTDKHGTQWFAKNTSDGKQIWTTVRNNFIRDGGINDIPRTPNFITGLSRLTPPRRTIGGK